MSKVKACGLAILSVVLVFGHAGRAQSQSIGATDNELYAGYCKGVISEVLTGATATPPLVTGQSDRQRQAFLAGRQKLFIEAKNSEVRFSSYLLSTGVISNPGRNEAFLGVLTAIERGKKDSRQCSGTSKACSEAIFGPADAPLPKDDRTTQLGICYERDPACPRINRCFGPDNLPF